MNRIFILFMVMTFSLTSMAQKKSKKSKKSNKNRVEVDIAGSIRNFNVIPLDKEGVLLIYQKDKTEYTVIKYSTAMKKVYTTVISVNKNEELVDHAVHNGNTYMLFAKSNTGSGVTSQKTFSVSKKFKEYNLIVMDNETKKQTTISGKFNKQFAMDKMIIDDEIIVMLGNSSITSFNQSARTCFSIMFCYIPALFGSINFQNWPVIHTINQKTKDATTEYLTFNKRKRAQLLSGQVNTENNTGDMLVKCQLTRKKYATYVKPMTYTSKGLEIGNEWEMNVEEGKEIATCIFNTISEKEKVLIGSYGSTNRKIKVRGLSALVEPEGVFISKLNAKKQQYMKYYGFADFKPYKTQFLGKSAQKKLDKSKGKGKNATVGRYILFHNLVETEDQFIMTGETYYPTYHTEVYYTYVNGRMQRNYRTVFDGFLYEAGLVAGFTKDGKLKWSDAFALPWHRTFNLADRVIKIATSGDDLTFSVCVGGVIVTRYLKDEHLSKSEVDAVLTKTKKGEYEINLSTNANYWYEGFYIAYGTAEKGSHDTKYDEKKDSKTVIFLQKIEMSKAKDEDNEEDEDDEE